MLRLNQQTVRNWIDAGSLPAIRVGRRVRIKREDLDRILESGYQGTPLPAGAAAGPNADDFWSGEPVGAVGVSQDEGPPGTDLNANRAEASGRPVTGATGPR